jgi:hypothetical protein
LRTVHVAAGWAIGTVGDFDRGQEGRDRIGDDRGGSPGQVMTSALDELQASIRQGACQPAGGFEGNHGVPGVGEQENRRPDRLKSVLKLAELAQQGALFGQEGPP